MLDNVTKPDVFVLIKGYLKEPSKKWHNFLAGKNLLLSNGLENTWELLGIYGEENLESFCRYVWNTGIEHKYKSIEDMIEDVSLNNRFSFNKDEIEILDCLMEFDLVKNAVLRRAVC